MRSLISACIFLFVVSTLGCGGPNVKFSGKVTYPDGKPVTVGLVCFSTATYMSSGQLQPDGTYSLGSLSEADGIPPGKYKVYIQGSTEEKPNGQMTYLVAPKFTEMASTPLEYEIKKGEDPHYDFTVEYPAK